MSRAELDAFISEKAFLETVIGFARARHWRVYHTFNSRRSETGFPDLVLVRDRVVFIELKTERGRVRTDQIDWHDDLLDAGAEAYIFRPRDWGRIERILA